ARVVTVADVDPPVRTDRDGVRKMELARRRTRLPPRREEFSITVELHHPAIPVAIGDVDLSRPPEGHIRRSIELILARAGTPFRTQGQQQLTCLVELTDQVPVTIRDPDKILLIDANPMSALHVGIAADQRRSPGAKQLSRGVEAQDGRGLA